MAIVFLLIIIAYHAKQREVPKLGMILWFDYSKMDKLIQNHLEVFSKNTALFLHKGAIIF